MKPIHWAIAAIIVACGLLMSVRLWPANFFPPSEADGKVALRRIISRESEGRIQLVSFTSLKTEEAELNDPSTLQPVTGYLMEFEATITFKENCQWGFFLTDTNGKAWWMREFYTYVPSSTGVPPKYDADEMREGRVAMTNTLRSSLVFFRQAGRWSGKINRMGTVD